MTRFDAIRRQLADIEKNHERALEKREMQVRVMAAYRDELEDHGAIAVEMLSGFMGISVDDVNAVIGQRYEREQKAKVTA